MGKLLGIVTRAKSRAPMEPRESIPVSREAGLEGDSRGRTRDRNVTVITREGWDATCKTLGDDLPWTTRRANLLVEGVDLTETTGARVRIGEVLLEVTGECEPCALMDKFRDGLREALTPEWRAGVMCRVLEEGTLQLGEAVSVETPR